MDIIRRIECLRREMACEGIDIYIVPSADCHGSEYVGDYFKIRQYLTGFTGSAGTAVFTRIRPVSGQTEDIIFRQKNS